MIKYKYKFSIIIPVYNADQYLEATIKSIINQKFELKDIQIILIDDGSHDNSKDICSYYYSEYPNNIIFIEQENKGVSSARNEGIRNSKGKYILFLDSDDLLTLNVLKNLYFFFEKNYNNIDIVVYPFKYLMPDNTYKYHFRYRKLYKKGTYIYDIEKYPELIQATVNFCIKNNYDKNILFDENIKFSEDEDYATKIIMNKRKIGYCSDCYYIYRKHAKSANGKYVMTQEVFDKFINYYRKILTDYDNISYIQNLYLNTLRWRILEDKLWPIDINEKQKEKNLLEVSKLLSHIDISSINKISSINIFHKVYLYKLKKSNFKVIITKNKYQLISDGLPIISDNEFKCLIKNIDFSDGKISINGILLTPLFEFIKPKLVLEYNGNEKSIKLFKSDYSKYKSSTETNYMYEFNTSLDYNINCNISLYIEINKIKFMLIPIFNEKSKKFTITKKYLYLSKNNDIVVSKSNIVKEVTLNTEMFAKKVIKKLRG